MRTSVPGSDARRRSTGFTLIELLVVVAIVAVATVGVTFALRDNSGAQLEQEARRLSALFESARAQSRSTGMPVVWHSFPGGFRFEGVPAGALPDHWLRDTTVVQDGGRIVLGPEPVIGPQEVVIGSSASPGNSLRIATDGVRPFGVEAATP
ncbi:prepilin-type N-terminal cleavage/methylation domain-containing protein [Ramlibacter humi]|uniref:Type II secretion system protein GspH n=1 Tax=Ramlibacter humi TaxID=2530451 RepID=A0A4Z0BW50_9BURK|nr:prepilin-type N-terminal cleavage/methylation domain-containing protein [Ramlibacter humi]TFZ03546.1 type II secretion system protein GspH [Ramlibacter humi]